MISYRRNSSVVRVPVPRILFSSTISFLYARTGTEDGLVLVFRQVIESHLQKGRSSLNGKTKISTGWPSNNTPTRYHDLIHEQIPDVESIWFAVFLLAVRSIDGVKWIRDFSVVPILEYVITVSRTISSSNELWRVYTEFLESLVPYFFPSEVMIYNSSRLSFKCSEFLAFTTFAHDKWWQMRAVCDN